jgi:hypothetical protein
MNNKELNYWKSKFRILDKWNIRLLDDDAYTGMCGFNIKTKAADIYPWGDNKEAEDYILHELLHICMAELRSLKSYKKKREAEELFVQDLCSIIIGQ